MRYSMVSRFIDAATKEDKPFVIFPYHWSDYNLVEELPPVINNVETMPEEVEDWLHYFPEAKPHGQGGDIYIAILIGLSIFPKFYQEISLWCREKKYGLWLSSLQSEKPVLMGWLLFSTNMMDTEILKLAILAAIYDVLVGLRWKMIHGNLRKS